MVFSNKVYDCMKWIAQYFLPALATLWITLSKIWGLPYGTEIGATLTGVDLFLGALLGISSHNYQGDGTISVNEDDPTKDVYTLNYNGDLNEIAEKKSVTFTITK